MNINNNHYYHLKSDEDDDDDDDDDDEYDVRRVKKVMRSKLSGGDMVRTYYQHNKLCRCCVQYSGGVVKQTELNLSFMEREFRKWSGGFRALFD